MKLIHLTPPSRAGGVRQRRRSGTSFLGGRRSGLRGGATARRNEGEASAVSGAVKGAGPLLPLLVAAAAAVGAVATAAAPSSLAAQAPVDPLRGAELRISRAAGPIVVDGDLSDPGWKGAAPIDVWYETNPGDNVPPKVGNVAYLAYDDRSLYAGFRFDDPDPSKIRAPLADRDSLGGETDYGGIILDTRNDGRTGLELLANPRGIQYDAVTDDGNEDSSPDFFWESAGKVTATGWTLEIRIPFASLRYPKEEVQTWGILLYRNWPRDFRRQMFSAKLPRGRSCFICSENVLTGLRGLPAGGNLVVAPYGTAAQETVPREAPGSGLVTKPIALDAGVDLKWTPTAGVALDATVNPDFSQVESDVAQLTANERFALLYPEKRPFFLEGVELFSTPVQAVYTRTVTSPRWGARVTGKLGGTGFTALVADDRGGGSVILPGANGSDLANQDFASTVLVGRARQDIGRSFVSFLATDREIRGGGSNRVFGPDFQWKPNDRDVVAGQLLFSRSATPNRPDLASEWDGRTLSGHAAVVSWNHTTAKVDWFGQYRDLADGFRADVGFVPQVGIREGELEGGYTWRPTGFVNRLRAFLYADYTGDRDDGLVTRIVSPGFGFDGKANTSVRLRLSEEKVRAGDTPLPRTRLVYTIQTSPSRLFALLTLDGTVGEEVDFANVRRGHGGRTALTATVRPGDHLALDALGEVRWLKVPAGDGGPERRLFTAHVERLKATWTFTARSFVRLIGQYVGERRNPELYRDQVAAEDGSFSASVLFAYKLNWQSVLYLGYGDARTLTDDGGLAVQNRQLFLKVSYAFQR